jgi:membrane-bound lytic murein transglycosylase B
MKPLTHALSAALISVAALAAALPAFAQDKPRTAMVAIYHVAPGKQLEFLKWMAAREGVDKEAGVAATQWYAHLDGDSWDYVAIAPDLDDATSDKVDEMVRKRGLTAGPKAGLEFRTMISSHTDTYVAGPYTATELVDRYTRP